MFYIEEARVIVTTGRKDVKSLHKRVLLPDVTYYAKKRKFTGISMSRGQYCRVFKSIKSKIAIFVPIYVIFLNEHKGGCMLKPHEMKLWIFFPFSAK